MLQRTGLETQTLRLRGKEIEIETTTYYCPFLLLLLLTRLSWQPFNQIRTRSPFLNRLGYF